MLNNLVKTDPSEIKRTYNIRKKQTRFYYCVYPKRFINKFFNKISIFIAIFYLEIINFIYNRLFYCNQTFYCVSMVSVTSASR